MVKDRESAIEKANIVHNGKYSYDKLVYKTTKDKVTITCPKHGDFEQRLSSHLAGDGCRQCGIEERNSKNSITTDQFIEKAKKIHEDKYDYSLVNYINAKTKVKIICKIHGEFLQQPNSHSSGNGCPECGKQSSINKRSKNQTLTQEKFIKRCIEVHGENLDFSNTIYKGSDEIVYVKCLKHGDYKVLARNLLKGTECRQCSIEKQTLNKYSNTKEFINKAKKIHGEKLYDYDKVNYKNSIEPITITCNKHNKEFQVKPTEHLLGRGCPSCNVIGSKYEKELQKFLESFVDIEINTRKIISPKELDIFIPSKNIAIEFNGLYWHNEDKVGKKYHSNKTEDCNKKGIQLIHVFEDEWLNKRDIVKSRIKSLIGFTENKIFARKTEIREVSYSDSKIFLEKNHLQGNSISKIRYGLYFNNKLVSLMTFGKLRKNLGNSHKEGEYELLRFCNTKNTVVIGAASKLLKHFERENSPTKLISYADRRYSKGNLYKKLAFKFCGITKNNYFYIPYGSIQRLNRYNFTKHSLVNQGYNSNLTENEIMKSRGFTKIYDCGSIKFEKLYK